MNSPIQKYFQVGTIQWMTHPPVDYPLLDSLKILASDDYFSALEITAIQEDDTREKVKKLLEQSHLKICFGAQPILLGQGLNPNAIEETERKKAEQALISALDQAQYLGANSLAFLAGKWEASTKKEAFSQLLKTTRALCDAGKKRNMFIELEVFDFDMDKAALIGPAPLAAEFAAQMRTSHNNFGLLVDLSHFPTTYESTSFVIRSLRPYITHFHIGNAVIEKGAEAYGDLHPRFGFPGSANDTNELVEFFTILQEEGFFDSQNPYVLSLEVKPWAEEDAGIILANTKRVINRAWSLVEEKR